MKVKNLKLIAKTDEDLRQYPLIYKTQQLKHRIANLKKIDFSMQLNRFMWEDVEKGVLEKKKN